MHLHTLQSALGDLPIFSLGDIRKIDPSFPREQLAYWVANGKIDSFAGRYYRFPHRSMDQALLFMAVNLLYQPSYISLESALEARHVIPESVLGVTSISSRKTKRFDSAWGAIHYRSVKPVLMFGYQVIEARRAVKYRIARLEKAILDFLYLHPHLSAVSDFEALRWNRIEMRENLNHQLFLDYLHIFDSKAVAARAELFMEFIHA